MHNLIHKNYPIHILAESNFSVHIWGCHFCSFEALSTLLHMKRHLSTNKSDLSTKNLTKEEASMCVITQMCQPVCTNPCEDSKSTTQALIVLWFFMESSPNSLMEILRNCAKRTAISRDTSQEYPTFNNLVNENFTMGACIFP
jgi:hypothetical protein